MSTAPNPITKWLARGALRGPISQHRTEAAARRAVEKDIRVGARGGIRSDAKVYALHRNGDMTGPYPKQQEF